MYTKHYYAGSERVSAKTGTAFDLGYYPSTALATAMPQLNATAIDGISDTHLGTAATAIASVHTRLGATPPTLRPIMGDGDTLGANHDEELLDYYYFHHDHLGSSSYITNGAGTISQHMEYLPFGETLVDEHINSKNSPFKYNGKEYDEETGNYYYGARYYDPKLSIFISVDPLTEKYPGVSPYAYCYNNPIKYIDPTGMEGEDPTDPPKKNILIVLDFNPQSPVTDKERDKIKFNNLEENNWHGIYAKNLQDADEQLTDYLNGNKADNVMIVTHGGVTQDGKDSGLRVDNNTNEWIMASQIKNYESGNCSPLDSKSIKNIDALVNIASNVKDNKNLIIHACNLATHDFFDSLQSITGSRIDMFGSVDIIGIWGNHLGNSTTQYSDTFLNKDFISQEDYKGGARMYPAGYQAGDTPITLKNLQVNKGGVKTIK